MKLNNDIFRSRYWLPGIIAGALFFFLITLYFGYLMWQNVQQDDQDLQLVREFQSLTPNTLTFSFNC